VIAVVHPPGPAGTPPCIAQFTRRVALHVGVRTWCQKEVDASAGVFQVPDETPVCPECEALIGQFRLRLGPPVKPA
jgi:hypothetical protein